MTIAASSVLTPSRASGNQDDPVLAALRRARLRPPPPEEERQRLIAYANRPKGPYLTTEQFDERLAALRSDAE